MRSISFVLGFFTLSAVSPAQDLQPRPGAPVPGLTQSEYDLFLAGLAAFNAPLQPAEGLGPIFNDVSCSSCHNQPAAGGFGSNHVMRFGLAAAGGAPFDPLASLGGSLLQEQSIDPANCLEVIPASATVTSDRATPICFGLGLVEAIPDSELLANVSGQPAGFNGFSQMSVPIESPGGLARPGRMGWKGGVPTVHSFSLDAALNEMGLTSTFLMTENAPNGDLAALAACDTVPEPEDLPDAQGVTRTERFTHFQQFLAPPPQTPKSGMAGEALFASIGCAVCHRPEYVTGPAVSPALTGKLIHPYSDYLVHDMGALGDGIVDGAASESDMMTRALWGLVQRPELLHDGRATNGTFDQIVRAAITEHDGEGAASRAAFQALSLADQDRVVDFLRSLGRQEFDIELDQTIDEFDWFFLEPLMTGPVSGAPISPDDEGAIADVDQDGDFDLVEFGLFQRAFTAGLPLVLPPAITPPVGLDISLESNGSNLVSVAPGAAVPYSVVASLAQPGYQGLGMFAFDLSFDGGPLTLATAPAGGVLANFISPLGINNPAGFGGTLQGGALRQVGGAQNTIRSTFAPQPTGQVDLGIGNFGTPAVLAQGTLTAPTAPGVYRLSIDNVVANAIQGGSVGVPFWEVHPATAGSVDELIIEVGACEVQTYCLGKVNSIGCRPVLSATGTPSVGGLDDFHVWARGLVPGQLCVGFYGFAAASQPFFGGTLCVDGPHRRLAPAAASMQPNCAARVELPFTHATMAAAGITPGTDVFVQVWQRDPNHPDGTGVGLSNGLRFRACP